jgi:murein DD-endopeptidase MepM/ murein hydrolase activator NlpD
MSYRSGQYPEQSQRHAQDHARPPHHRRPPQTHAHHRPRQDGHDYALVHHGKQIRVGPVVFWIVTGSIILMGAWSAATATYFAFRDDVLTRLIARQAEMQYAYEDRIAELRSRIDRTTSRQLLDQEQYDQKLGQIVKRQQMLESRTNALGSLPDISATGSIKPSRTSLTNDRNSHATPKPSPISDTMMFTAPPDREARLESRRPAIEAPATRFAKAPIADSALAKLQTSLDRIESRQTAALTSLEDKYESRLRRMRGLFTDLGLNMHRMAAAAPRGGVGGPFVPVKPGHNAGAFERQLYQISLTRVEADKMARTLALVPYRKPVVGQVEFTSGFGVRSDPFLGRPAMHTGLDFRAAKGDPVRVTANGKVVSAGWAGGYGRMVEVDHGNGLSTRYGHLSEINVKVGQSVTIGEVIGEVGSTGRSTGPHLHYETRIDGVAVDPQKFLRAGVRFAQG